MPGPLPIVGSCDDCAACCGVVTLPPFRRIFGEEGEEAWERLRWDRPDLLAGFLEAEQSRKAEGLPSFGSPCLWLDPALGRCRHYEHRPRACRDFEVGGLDCLGARRRGQVGYPPPTPTEKTCDEDRVQAGLRPDRVAGRDRHHRAEATGGIPGRDLDINGQRGMVGSLTFAAITARSDHPDGATSGSATGACGSSRGASPEPSGGDPARSREARSSPQTAFEPDSPGPDASRCDP